MFDWMVWTTPVAVFFSCIAALLAGLHQSGVCRWSWLGDRGADLGKRAQCLVQLRAFHGGAGAHHEEGLMFQRCLYPALPGVHGHFMVVCRAAITSR